MVNTRRILIQSLIFLEDIKNIVDIKKYCYAENSRTILDLVAAIDRKQYQVSNAKTSFHEFL